MNLFRDITENKFVLVLLSEEQYDAKLAELVKLVEQEHAKICYVCLNKPYKETVEFLAENGLDVERFVFVDVLTSHYKKQSSTEQCIYVEDPSKIDGLQVAINQAVSERNCTIIVFDTLSSLLMYEQTHDIVRLTHHLSTEQKHVDINKVYIVLKEKGNLASYSETLVKDIGMFTDKTIEFDKST